MYEQNMRLRCFFSHVLTMTLHVDIENSGSPRSSCWREGKRGAARLLLPIMTGWTSHTHTHYILTQKHTQKLSVKPIPPNGHSLILLTGAQGGNEVCHLCIRDPWLTSLPHLPPPSWPGNGTLLGWDGGDRNRVWDSFEWSALTQTPACWVHKSPHKWGQSQCLAICFDFPPPLLAFTHTLTLITVSNHARQCCDDASVEEQEKGGEWSCNTKTLSSVRSYYLFDAYTTHTGTDWHTSATHK